jgi:MscS family membrane protein
MPEPESYAAGPDAIHIGVDPSSLRSFATRLIPFLASTLLLAAVAGGLARAESHEGDPPAAERPSVEDFSKPMGPRDPFNRGTPRGSMYGFLGATRKGDYERAENFLDLRRLPAEDQERGPQLARQLKAVLDQTLWVDLSTLSDRNEGFADDDLPGWQDRLGQIETSEGPVTLLLQRVPREGDGVRIWKIASATVARTAVLYEEIGPGRLEAWLPPVFFDVELLALALWQWVGLVLLGAAGMLISALVSGTAIRVLGALVTVTGRQLDDRIVLVLRGPVRLALAILIFSIGRRSLGLDAPVVETLQVLERLLWVVALASLVFRIIDITVVGIRIRSERQGNLGVLPALVPLQGFAKVLIVFLALLGVLSALGVNITAAVAGLGVGGIAIALAAQKSLENLLGGVNLFVDRPVRVGDFFRYGTEMGTVEEIGLRSTRVRTLDRTVVTIPNAEFSNLRLENFARRDRLRLWTMIRVRYETTPDQLRYVLTRLREILLAHPRVTDDPARVRFVGFGDYSLDIEVFAYVDTAEWPEFLGIREEIYLLFMDVIDEAGTGFAFPSTTTYLGRDGGLDEQESRRAEARVAEWREKGELPFPNHPDSARQEIWNTLEWPPRGSPGASKG